MKKLLLGLLFVLPVFGQLPPVTSGLQWWFDARYITGVINGGTISNWSDLSGNGHTASVNTGTATWNTNQYNGGAALTLASCSMAISGAVTTTGIYTIIAVVRTTAATSGQFILGASTTFGIEYLMGFATGGINRVQAAFSGGGTGFENYGTATSDTSWHLINMRQNATVSLAFRIDGATDPNSATNVLAAGNPAPDLIGASSIGQYLVGQVQILGYYNRVLTDPEILVIENYIIGQATQIGVTITGP